MNSYTGSNTIGTEPNNMETLVNAGKSIEKVIKQDQVHIDLFQLLPGSLSEVYIKPLISTAEAFLKTSDVPIPNTLLQRMDGLLCRCFMGLLPEIGRAWITMDHCLYIWSYTDPSEIYEYQDQDQIIVGVGLVKTKPDIFGNNINYLLILSTPLQVIPLALSVSANEFQVYATNMIVSADDVQMNTIVGSDEGRVFMIGYNGNLYEFGYNHPGSWFTRKSYIDNKSSPSYTRFLPSFATQGYTADIKSLTIDNERKVLYLLGNDSSIEVVYLGDPSNNYKPIIKNTSIIETAIHMCQTQGRIFSPDVFKLESVHIISKAESKYIHLVAMTSAGFRLYFTHHKEGFRVLNDTVTEPASLELGHIRIPPQDPNPVRGQPSFLCRNTYYDCGVCLTVKTQNDDMDTIHIIAAAPNAVSTAQQQPIPSYSGLAMTPRPVLVETNSKVETNATTWTLTESRPELKGKRQMKEIAEQLSDPSRQFMVLTSRSISFYKKLRPVDILFGILEQQDRTIQEEQKDCQLFFERYSQTESCAMCLSVICNSDDPIVVRKATNLFFDFGGRPTAASSLQAPENHLGQVVGQTSVTFSGKHEGFVLYFARIVAPIWNLNFFATSDFSTNTNASALYAETQSKLFNARGNLEKLKQFMDRNPGFHDFANISDPRFQAADRTQLDLDLAEQKSVHELYLLLGQCIDVVYFVEFLLNSGIQKIIAQDSIDPAYLEHVYKLDINIMLTTAYGRELSRELVIAAIRKYGGTQSHTGFDIVSSQLQKCCSNYFSSKDILFFKGMEHLKLTMSTDTEYERIPAIKESLHYFKEAADNVSYAKMEPICRIYIQYSFHIGIIELALERAQKQDPQNQAVLAYESEKNRDEAKMGLLRARMESYGFALAALDDAHLLKSQPLSPSRAPVSDPNVFFRNVIDTAIRSNDKLFHFRLYGWFLKNNLQEELLQVDTPFLVTYFQKYVNDKKCSLEFLWSYYRSRGFFFQAALSLKQLAFSDSPVLTLVERSSRLSFASVNARSAVSENDLDPNLPVFAAELQKNIHDCNLQTRIQDILKSQTNNAEAQLAAASLDRALFSSHELWIHYGSKFPILHRVFQEN